jgi:hypothetical protein
VCSGGTASFDFTASNKGGKTRGTLTYSDSGAGIAFTKAAILTFQRDGITATMTGTGFTLVVTDNGEPQTDVFQLSVPVSGGTYHSPDHLASGNLQVRSS